MYCNSCGKNISEDVRFYSYAHRGCVAPAPRNFMRSRADRKIAGVCAGLAHYYDLDVTLVRTVCIFIALATGVCPASSPTSSHGSSFHRTRN